MRMHCTAGIIPLLIAASGAAAQVQFTPLELGPPGVASAATGVNDAGQVALHANGHAYRWSQAEGLVDLGTIGVSLQTTGIMSDGSVVGTYLLPTFQERAFIYRAGQLVDLGALTGAGGSAAARAVNSQGDVVGSSTGEIGAPRAWRRTPQGMADLDALVHSAMPSFPYTLSVAFGINNGGQVVGQASATAARGFRYNSPTSVLVLEPVAPFTGSVATAVNNQGAATGDSSDAFGNRHATLWSASGAAADLGTPPGTTFSTGLDVNDSGLVVGNAWFSITSPPVPFIAGVGANRNLNTLIAPSGWVLQTATAINNSNMIVGTGFYNGLIRAYVLTPVSVTCYANCDNSTAAPVLNVNDFLCFQTRFAAGDTYANCDGSTNPPILNLNDLLCFQGRFAAGCP